MLNKIISFSIRNKLIVGLLVLALTGWGVYNLTRLPIDAVPDITNNQVLIITSSPSLGAADIERLITFPLEQATRNIPGMLEQRSFSRFGLSLITLVFSDETDVYWARQQVSERLIQVQSQIPQGLGVPELGPVTTGLGEIFQYVVRPKPGYEGKYTPMELRTIQDWIIRRQLLGTPGVADVSSFGGQLKQYEIGINPDRLKAYNLTITDVFAALEKSNQNTGGAYIEKGPTVLYIRSEGLLQTREEIGNTVVKTLPDGTPVLVRHLATVSLGPAIRYGALCYNDQGEVAGAVVMMLKGENSSQVIKDVKTKITQIEKTLPEGVVIEPFLDRTKMVNNAIHTVEKNLMEGALIVIFILVIFLGNARAGLIVASVIPLSMLFAIGMMNLFGVSGNLMSLGALDFGLIVDGAVIIVEAVMHRLHHGKQFLTVPRIDQKKMDEEVRLSASKMMNAAVFGQIIILIVYLPILTLQGIEGKMFKPMAQTVAFAIMGAFLLSLTYVPMMSALVLSKKISHKKTFADRMMEKLEGGYQPLLIRALHFRKTVLAVTFSLFVSALLILMNLGGEFIPKLEEGDFAVDTRVLTGSSLTTTIESTQKTAGILLRRFPEVEKVVTKIGSGEIPTDPMPMEASDMMVILKPKDEWTSARSFDELAEKMSHALADVPGVTAGFQFPVQMRFNELMTGGRQDVVCKIFGEDLDTLAHYAQQVGGLIATIDGARDVYVETQTGLPQIVVQYNRAALAQYGLTVADINRFLEAAFASAVSGQIFENERRFDLVVRLTSDSRRDVRDVQNLLIATPRGEQIPLYQVADVQIKVGPNQIQRENAQRRTSIGFNVRGADVQTVVHNLQRRLEQQIKLPAGYYITYGGQFENLVAAKKRLSIAVPIALALIFVLLYFAFHSVAQGLLIYTAIPLSAIGGVFALWLRGMPFSISAGVGFIALFGVAVLNGIVLITEFNHLKKSGIANIRQRILLGTRTRLRPVLMTASVASLGFLPMALSNGAGAEVQRPLATVVIGGLVSATLLTLLVLPVLYQMFNREGTDPNKPKKGLNPFKPGRNTATITALLVAFIATGLQAQAQERTISLQAALQQALQQNRSIRASAQQTEAARQWEGTAWNLPQTSITAEYGQINSALNDSRVGIAQPVSFPVVYRRQKEWLQAQTQGSRLQEDLVRLDVKKQVVRLYYQLLLLQERKKLLLQADSVYEQFQLRQERRFQAGDANLTEKTAAETQRRQVGNQLNRLEADFRTVQSRFGYLLNSPEALVPQDTSIKMTLEVFPDTTQINRYPFVQWKQQQQKIAGHEIEVNKALMLPQISVGYNNQSLVGFQNVDGTEKYFRAGQRFSSVFTGISLPLFNKAGKARIRASQGRYAAAQTEYADAQALHRATLQQLLLQYKKNSQTLHYFETSALKQAGVLAQQAALQFNNGDIGYIEWMLLINQSIALRAEYLDAVQEWNETVLELKSYTSDF